ncbi:uncharacterized protein PG986_007468 [Apiospora aurea]|uniref:Uncharacterized protein n=1 Tax=Apiospora aurea TaxID=335848 RepID=A0ABR1QCN9_9PEZI
MPDFGLTRAKKKKKKKKRKNSTTQQMGIIRRRSWDDSRITPLGAKENAKNKVATIAISRTM